MYTEYRLPIGEKYSQAFPILAALFGKVWKVEEERGGRRALGDKAVLL